jgi:hypothetical protein
LPSFHIPLTAEEALCRHFLSGRNHKARYTIPFGPVGRMEREAVKMALQKQYSQQEKDETNAKLKEVTTFLIEPH